MMPRPRTPVPTAQPKVIPGGHLPGLSRRAVLTGGLSAALLVACGTDKTNKGGGNSTPATASDGSRFSLVAFFGGPDAVQAGIAQRVTFGLGDAQGALIDNGPTSLDFEVVFDDKVVNHVTAARHRQGLPRGYYPLTFVPQRPGYYTVRTKVERDKVDATFQVANKVAIPQAGQPMVIIDTPTTADHRGVNPICTRSPMCPLHAVNLRDALANHKPVALLMATPAYCQTAICGPVLDVLISQQREFGDRVQMIHAEVYADGKQAADNISQATLAPALQAYHLPFEPSLFLSKPNGTIATRIDTTFDEVELRAALHWLLT